MELRIRYYNHAGDRSFRIIRNYNGEIISHRWFSYITSGLPNSAGYDVKYSNIMIAFCQETKWVCA